MKTKITCLGLLVLIVCASCGGKKEVSIESPFNPALQEAIDDFLAYNKEKRDTNICIFKIRPYFDESQNKHYLYFTLSQYYDAERTRYYFEKDGFVFLYGRGVPVPPKDGSLAKDDFDSLDTISVKDLIDFGKMKKYKDSIPNYSRAIGNPNTVYDGAYYRIVEIVNSDSLKVVVEVAR